MWRRKFPKLRVINFVVRHNRTYRMLFRKNELFIDDKLTWIRENENIELNTRCLINLIGTSPQNFRRRMKKRMKKNRLKDKGKILEKDSFIERK